jgi:acetyl-CoA synthetase
VFAVNDVLVIRPAIVKDLVRFRCRPNLVDYAAARAVFDWSKARRFLDGLPDGRGLNIAHEAVDRHAVGARADRVALRWIGKSGERRDITYRALAAETNRFANAVGRRGGRGA